MTDLKSRRASLNAIQPADSQRRIWFLECLDGASAACNMPAAFLLRGELNTATRELLRDEARRVFNLENDQPIRTCLLRLAANDHVRCLTLRRVASDGWSTEVLMREFSVLCNAFNAGKASPLLDLPLQYADYPAWQHRELAEGNKVVLSPAGWQA